MASTRIEIQAVIAYGHALGAAWDAWLEDQSCMSWLCDKPAKNKIRAKNVINRMGRNLRNTRCHYCRVGCGYINRQSKQKGRR